MTQGKKSARVYIPQAPNYSVPSELRLPELLEKFNSASKAWFLNVISIEEGYNYAAASSERLDRYFADLLDLKESGEILISKRVYLRKEILKLMQESED